MWQSPIGERVSFCCVTCTQSLALHPICFFVSPRNERRTIISLLHQRGIEPLIKHMSGAIGPNAELPLVMPPHLIWTPKNFLRRPLLSIIYWVRFIGRRAPGLGDSPLSYPRCAPAGSIVNQRHLIVRRVLRGSAPTSGGSVSSFVPRPTFVCPDWALSLCCYERIPDLVAPTWRF